MPTQEFSEPPRVSPTGNADRNRVAELDPDVAERLRLGIVRPQDVGVFGNIWDGDTRELVA